MWLFGPDARAWRAKDNGRQPALNQFGLFGIRYGIVNLKMDQIDHTRGEIEVGLRCRECAAADAVMIGEALDGDYGSERMAVF
jgi:hypothetical protein